MIRAAAKNYKFVTVITDPEDYRLVIDELKNNGDTTAETKEMLAAKVFIHTAHYDALIAGYFSERLNIKYPKTLRKSKIFGTAKIPIKVLLFMLLY